MAGALPDGRNVEQGGSVGGGVGADDERFTSHVYIPAEALYAEGDAMGSPVGRRRRRWGRRKGGSISAVFAKKIRNAEDKVEDKARDVENVKLERSELPTDASAPKRAKADAKATKAEREHTRASREVDTRGE